MKYLPYILIVLVLLLAGGYYIDQKQSVSVRPFTSSPQSNMTKPGIKNTLPNYGPAPEFFGINKWLNLPALPTGQAGGETGSAPLTMAGLKGKVVLIDFWTYSCINCIRTLPYVTKWYDTYKDQGFVIVGVHTPEFAFEKVTSNVEKAIKMYGINYPVAQDNDFGTWQAYSNQYWPAHYLIDKEGNIRYVHFGEGKYEEMENAIRQLLDVGAGLGRPSLESGAREVPAPTGTVKSPEMYFGTYRLENLASEQKPSAQATNYSLPTTLSNNTFALEGQWKFDGEKATTAGPGKIRLKFYAGKVFMVAASEKPVTIKIRIDGKFQGLVNVEMSALYTLFDSTDYSEHIIDIEIPKAEFEAFTFTFG